MLNRSNAVINLASKCSVSLQHIICVLGGPNAGETFQGPQGYGHKCRLQPQYETAG